MSKKRIGATRRELMQATGGLAGASLLGGCGEESESAPTTQEAESDLLECLSSKRRKHAMKPRGVFGQIEHVVVLMMENRSFDHVFGALTIPRGMTDAYGNDLGGEGRRGINGLTGDEMNLDLGGIERRIHRLRESAIGDIAHEWDNCRRQFD